MKYIEQLKDEVTDSIKAAFKRATGQEFEVQLEYPPEVSMGDFAVGCFRMAKELKSPPVTIASKVAEELKNEGIIESAAAQGPYINIKLKNNALFSTVCKEVLETQDGFGNSNIGISRKLMVEYLSPNTNKPLHLGHLRNGCLGMALARLLTKASFYVIKANLVNDRGVHICKSMLAWQKWGQGETPESTEMKGDHFVGKWYVRFNQEAEKNPKLNDEALELLGKWENNDPEVIGLWQKMNGWVYTGFKETYEKVGFEFDVEYHESETYKLGKEVIDQGLAKGVFYQDEDGAIVADLDKEEFGLNQDGSSKKITLQRADGTSLYMTQDLGTAEKKVADYGLDRSVHVVGSEQDYHFKVLIYLLKRLGYKWADGLYHLSYGMVFLPEGKMKSREGTVVDADDLVAQMEKLAREEIKKRFPDLKYEEIEERGHKVALAAIKFYLLNTSPQQPITFDPSRSISFEGATGPYIQYAYARANSILTKAKAVTDRDEVDFSLLGNDEERALALKLIEFKNQLKIAAQEYNPTRVANATYAIAVSFNQFYQKHQVISAETSELKQARIILLQTAMSSIKTGLNILGIDVIDSM